MVTIDTSGQTNGQEAESPLQRQWPQLGRELFILERALAGTVKEGEKSLTEREEREKRERIRDKIIAQLYRDEDKYSLDARYCALLLVKSGRGAEIVGNAFYVGKDGCRHELPYTGLEGYYAGSERTSERPGLTPEEIIQEEANIGVELLRSIKKHNIDNNSWASFSKMNRALKDGKPDLEDLRNVRLLWAEVVRRLHVRMYHNKEFESTLTEQIEQVEKLLSAAASRTREEKEYKQILEAEYAKLRGERNNMSEEEREHERVERRERERIRRERLSEYNAFREETYTMLKEAGSNEYDISVRDTNLQEANIIETVTLSRTPSRDTYMSVIVKLTPEQLAGYLFLAELGEIGGDPLTRSVLTSE